VFNIVTQQDSAANVDIAIKMAHDGSSIKAITILTMIFLPGTFVAVCFAEYLHIVNILNSLIGNFLKRSLQSKQIRQHGTDSSLLAVHHSIVRADIDHFHVMVLSSRAS
jgi:hypothetical protein